MKRYALLVLIIFLWTDILSADENIIPFTLPRLGTDQQVSLDDFKGSIIVLDFFSANCGKCYRASLDIQTGIEEYYASKSGNPQGIPVRVVAVSSEDARPDDMEIFLDDTELKLVLDNKKGTLLEQYGGTTLPYIVVIDASGMKDQSPRLVYAVEGYDGLDRLRRVIDGIGSKNPIQNNKEDLNNAVTSEILFDISTITASDAFVTDTAAEYQQKGESMEYSISISYRHIDIDYSSFYLDDIRSENLNENWFGFNSSITFDLNNTLSLSVDAGAYDGYQTYRAVWLDNYYRHVFGVLKGFIEGLEGYEKAEPWGYNASGSLRWEYLPHTGFVEAGIAYQHDTVSPGYEMSATVVRLRDRYNSWSGRLTAENILTRRMRSLVEFSISDTTERDQRYTLKASLNYALADHWVTRFNVAGAKERPSFRAKSISAVLERDWYDKWFVSIFGRWYEDTGEIENAVASSAAAPPLETYQAGLGLRMQGLKTSFKLAAGPCWNSYDRKPERDTAFDQLYRDRNWFSIQFAVLHQF
jgi:peroxiredoxin